MKTLKHWITAALLLLAFQVTATAGGEGWMTDLEAAKAKAKKENKFVLIEFTGSGWCPPCKMMQKEVFSKSEFLTKAKEKFILVVVDIPHPKVEFKDEAAKKAGRAKAELMKKFGVTGVPTVILLDSEGKPFSNFSAAQYPTPKKFTDYLSLAVRRKDMF